MKKRWEEPNLKNMTINDTAEDVVECPADIEAQIEAIGCPPEHDTNSSLRCNYPGCNHKRHKKSNPLGRCKCHDGVALPQS